LERTIWEITKNDDNSKEKLEEIVNVELRKKTIAEQQEELQEKKDQVFAGLKKFLVSQSEFDEKDFSTYLAEKKLINLGESWENLPLAKLNQFFEDYLEEEEILVLPNLDEENLDDNSEDNKPEIIIKDYICNEVIRLKNANILTPIEFYRENEEYG